MSLETFNAASPAEAAARIRPCADIDGWIDEIVAARPFSSTDRALAFAASAAERWSASDVDGALAHHPRIGERASGASAEAELSRGEQAGLGTPSEQTASELAAANAEYEGKFDRVFLIRAAGRSTDEILAECRRRLGNTAEAEAVEVAVQLREIALLRLEGVLTA
ncbi:2-oxo-4-hydroxy-4-carboxy-5-ureidoimidazoline decarboxylase [Leucobacter zeae]|nr:2-oxo-4-hydroxy-4-carboxy-5-ureidoimidazoline decarboxylase [Leucobacter zeae]